MKKNIYFAGGCFWGVQHYFDLVRGVAGTTCGYANGDTGNAPTYQEVYTDTTGFAETVKVQYNPERISLDALVQLFFLSIDPFSINAQGHDVGTRYRTGVYFETPEDEAPLREAYDAIAARLGRKPVTELLPLKNFFEAEAYHQQYLVKNPEGYCHLQPAVFKYLELYQDLEALLGDESDRVARMSQAAALIGQRMKFLWTGFYRVIGEKLVLGPFCGPPACLRIGYGKGVCGSAWEERRTLVVPDVEAFPGHIACSSLSRSEIVIPLFDAGGAVFAVLDIDSDRLDAFSEVDRRWLEAMAHFLE